MLPVVLLLVLTIWQVVLAGHAWWTLSESARLAARAAYVGERSGGDPAAAAESAAAAVLPAAMKVGHRTTVDADGEVAVTTSIPWVAPLQDLLGDHRAPRVTARSEFGR